MRSSIHPCASDRQTRMAPRTATTPCVALITWQVVSNGLLLRVDRRLSGALAHPDRYSELLADLGNIGLAVPVLAVVLAYVAWRGRAAGTSLQEAKSEPGILQQVVHTDVFGNCRIGKGFERRRALKLPRECPLLGQGVPDTRGLRSE